jgi:hypothetical protein
LSNCNNNWPGLKGTLVYGTGRYLNQFNITSQQLLVINSDASSTIAAVDVDSTRSQVYWVDGQKMRRSAIPKDILQVPDTQDMCTVSNAQGIAIDWIMRYTGWQSVCGGADFLPVALDESQSEAFVSFIAFTYTACDASKTSVPDI